MADEIWDGKSSLVFNAEDEQLTAITLDDDIFYVQIAREDFRIVDETLLGHRFRDIKENGVFWSAPSI
ncbi:hypothetical protein Ana3638_20500 [Anaerocolumna sedimenticola]|uniref:Uncharacterized protein n=1 Tax=Anaerocolumna sedimenticola TaxID=2696063 RepID=A0A6P1TTV4_9FIRM|nr:hypothetical protein [Anaerocolumna sedimenticola]QHQ62865.1 hypothetical protein Ana3638_20500 [Anaerocolumna sedimenticola]